MMHFWLNKGVDGFRLDVINLISKDQRFPSDDDEVTAENFIQMDRESMNILHEMNRTSFFKI